MRDLMRKIIINLKHCAAPRERAFSLPEAMIVTAIAGVIGYITTKGVVQINQSMTAKAAKSDSSQKIDELVNMVKAEFSRHVPALYPDENQGKNLLNNLRTIPTSNQSESDINNKYIGSTDPALLPTGIIMSGKEYSTGDVRNIYRKFVIEQEVENPVSGATSITRIEYSATCASGRSKNRPIITGKSWENVEQNQKTNGCIPASYCKWAEGDTLVIRKDIFLNWDNANDENGSVSPNESQCFPESFDVSTSYSPPRCILKQGVKDLQTQTIGMSFCAWSPNPADASNLFLRVWGYQVGPGSEVLYQVRDASFTRTYSLNNMQFINE